MARNLLYKIPLYWRNDSSFLQFSNWSLALLKPTKITEMFTRPTLFDHQRQHTGFRNNTNSNIRNSISNIILVQWIKIWHSNPPIKHGISWFVKLFTFLDRKSIIFSILELLKKNTNWRHHVSTKFWYLSTVLTFCEIDARSGELPKSFCKCLVAPAVTKFYTLVESRRNHSASIEFVHVFRWIQCTSSDPAFLKFALNVSFPLYSVHNKPLDHPERN